MVSADPPPLSFFLPRFSTSATVSRSRVSSCALLSYFQYLDKDQRRQIQSCPTASPSAYVPELNSSARLRTRQLQIAARIDRTGSRKFLIRSPRLFLPRRSTINMIGNKIRRSGRSTYVSDVEDSSFFRDPHLIAFAFLLPDVPRLSFSGSSPDLGHPTFPSLALLQCEWCKTIDSIPGRLVLTSFLSARFIEELRTLSRRGPQRVEYAREISTKDLN